MASNWELAGKVSPTNEGEWTSGVKYLHPCFVMHENTLFLSLRDNINREPGVSSDDWSELVKSGGGGTAGVKFSVRNVSGWNSKSVTQDANVTLQILWSSTEDDVPTGNGTLTLLVNNQQRYRTEVEQGTIDISVKEYLTIGENQIVAKVMDSYGNSRNVSVLVDVVNLSITSVFDPSVIQNGDITFFYTPYGTAEKTVYFYVDNVLIDTVETSVSSHQLTKIIPALAYGSHNIEVYFTAELDGVTSESNHLTYDIISVYGGGVSPIVTINTDSDTFAQYSNVIINYQVYDPNALIAEADVSVDGTVVSEQEVDRTLQTYSLKAYEVGETTIAVSCGNVSKSVTLTITDSGIHVEAETEGLALFLSSAGRSNTEIHRDVWEDTDNHVSAILTGFNWVSNGWLRDDDGATYLHVSNGASVTIPYKPFENDCRLNGMTIELEFSSSDILDYTTVIASCMSGGRGFQITPQFITLSSAESSITKQYKEDDHVRIAFVVERSDMGTRLIHCFINGIDSGTVRYGVNDDFQQQTPVNMTFGASGSAINLYAIRIYNIGLVSTENHARQLVENWIADSQNAEELVERYNRNNIYDDYGEISIPKLSEELPYMVLFASSYEDLPQYKGDKKNINGYFNYPSQPEKNFEFVNAQFNVQGTSSQFYSRKNYKAGWSKGTVTLPDGSEVKKIAINDGIAAGTWCLKADVASSEGWNNVGLVKLFNDLNPYKTPYQIANPLVRQGIDGFPGVVFWQDDNNKTHFLGKYNNNYDKSAENVFGFEDGDESWETKNNTSDHTRWKDNDFESTKVDKDGKVYPAWQDDFEARFPEDSEAITNLKALETWLMSTSRYKDVEDPQTHVKSRVSMATGDPITPITYEGVEYTTDTEEYRLAKFKAEVRSHYELTDIIFKYVFCEVFLMVDNWAKNCFPSLMGGSKWIDLPYDFDTAIGINNEGEYVFSPFLEDTDTVDNKDVYNGADSTLWCNLRDAFRPEISSMYNTLRNSGKFSYEYVEKLAEDHQAVWSENIYNEDAWFKYIQPLIDDNDETYLHMLQGSKAETRKYWLFNRFKYLDTKYVAGQAAQDYIMLRSYAKDDIGVVPFQPMYCGVLYGSTFVQVKGNANQETTVPNPLPSMNDTETIIYGASMVKGITDLTGLKVGQADFSRAINLQDLIVHDDDEHPNGNLHFLSLGNNKLLRTLVCKDVPNFTSSVDLSGCAGLTSANFAGSGITGVTLANGAIIETLILPTTVTNLTLRNTLNLETLTIGDNTDYSNITTLWADNAPIITESHTLLKDIINDMSTGSRFRVINMTISVSSREEISDLYDTLDTFTGLDEYGHNVPTAQISGTINVTVISQDYIDFLASRYPYVTIVGLGSGITVTFMNGSDVLFHDGVPINGTAVYPLATPTKDPTQEYDYVFSGWSSADGGTADPNILTGIRTAKTVYAAYTGIRFYAVTFKSADGSETLYVSRTQSGTTAVYEGPSVEDPNYDFTGWADSAGVLMGTNGILDNISGNKTVYVAQKPAGSRIIYYDGVMYDELKGVGSGGSGYQTSSGFYALDVGAMPAGGRFAGLYTNNKIEIDSYTKLHIYFGKTSAGGGGSDGGTFSGGLSTQNTDVGVPPSNIVYQNIGIWRHTNGRTIWSDVEEVYNAEVDITNVVGDVYVFAQSHQANIRVWRIWLEA